MSHWSRRALAPGLLTLGLATGGCQFFGEFTVARLQLEGPGVAYNLPAGAVIALTTTEPGRDTGLSARFNTTAGQLETFAAAITVPAAFTFNGFDALGPANTVIGHYAFDFAPSPNGDGLPEVVLTLRSISNDTAYVDINFNGTFQSGLEPVVTHSINLSGAHVFTATIPLGGDGLTGTTTAQFSAGILVSLATGILKNPTAPGVFTLSAVFTSVDPETDGANNNTGQTPLQVATTRDVTVASGPLLAAMLPSGRAVVFGTAATAFVSVINTGPVAATACRIALVTALRAQLTYQTTDPATNTLTGSANTPATIGPGAVGTFLVAVTPTPVLIPPARPLPPTDVEFQFLCANAGPAPILPGTNTLLLSAALLPVPDVIAIASTPTNDGIVLVPGLTGTGAFGVSGVNIGAPATITVRPVARPGVPVTMAICETTGSPTAQCQSPPAATVQAAFAADAPRTFSVFVAGTGTPIPVDLAASRASVFFEQTDGTVRGATSVAVQTGPP